MYPLKILEKIQKITAIWILRVFKMSLVEDIEIIAGLIPIKLHLQKLMGRSQLYTLLLPHNHLIQTFMDFSSNLPIRQHLILLKSFTDHQKATIKNHLVDSNNKSYGIFPSFSPLHPKLFLGSRIIDNFSDHFSFNLNNKEKNDKI